MVIRVIHVIYDNINSFNCYLGNSGILVDISEIIYHRLTKIQKFLCTMNCHELQRTKVNYKIIQQIIKLFM